MLWDEDSQEYCTYYAGGASGNVRAPEEYKGEHVSELIDVYSFGIVIYTLLTGLDPYWDEGIDDVHGQILLGVKPVVDIDIRNHSDIEGIMASVMDQCLEFDVEKRIDIFTVVSLLQDAIDKYGQTDSLTSVEWETLKLNVPSEGEDIDYDNDILGFGDDYYSYNDKDNNHERENYRDELR